MQRKFNGGAIINYGDLLPEINTSHHGSAVYKSGEYKERGLYILGSISGDEVSSKNGGLLDWHPIFKPDDFVRRAGDTMFGTLYLKSDSILRSPDPLINVLNLTNVNAIDGVHWGPIRWDAAGKTSTQISSVTDGVDSLGSLAISSRDTNGIISERVRFTRDGIRVVNIGTHIIQRNDGARTYIGEYLVGNLPHADYGIMSGQRGKVMATKKDTVGNILAQVSLLDENNNSIFPGYIEASRLKGKADFAGHADTADKAKHAEKADLATTALSANYATNAGTAGYATSAGSAGYATSAGSAGYATSAGSADLAQEAVWARGATQANTAGRLNQSVTITLAGDVTGSALFDGTRNITITTTGGAAPGPGPGPSDTANRLATPRRIGISGAVSGSAMFDGSADINIVTTGGGGGGGGGTGEFGVGSLIFGSWSFPGRDNRTLTYGTTVPGSEVSVPIAINDASYMDNGEAGGNGYSTLAFYSGNPLQGSWKWLGTTVSQRGSESGGNWAEGHQRMGPFIRVA